MSEIPQPRPNEIDIVTPDADPAAIAQDAAQEDGQFSERGVSETTEMQEDTPHDVSDQAANDSSTMDSQTEARIQELRDRGRVGVLTEGTERPDTSERMKNSDHDPDAIAAVNKASRATVVRNEDGTINRPFTMRGAYEYAGERRANNIAGYVDNGYDEKVKLFEENPEEWEAKERTRLEEKYPDDPVEVEDILSGMRGRIERIVLEDDKIYREVLEREKESFGKALEQETKVQDAYRGDMLDLYARDPEKYKAMTTEEFVAEGRRFKENSLDTAEAEARKAWGDWFAEHAPEMVEDASNIGEFADQLNKMVLRLLNSDGVSRADIYNFVESIEDKEVPEIDTVPKDGTKEERKEAFIAYQRGQDTRADTVNRLYSAGMHGYFKSAHLVPDLDRPPREQMREAVERAKKITGQWVEAGNKARADFEEKWGKAPEDKEPEPKAA